MTAQIDEQTWAFVVGPGASPYAVRYKGGEDDLSFNFENDSSTIDLPMFLLWGPNASLLDQAKRDICGYPLVTGIAGSQYVSRQTPMTALPFLKLNTTLQYLFAVSLRGTGWGTPQPQGSPVVSPSVQFPLYRQAKAEVHFETLTYDVFTDAQMITLGQTQGSSSVVTSVSITNAGNYSVAPSNPVSVTGGGGSGALLTRTYSGPGGTNHLIPPLSGTLIGVAVACGGSGYSPGDVLTFVGGTGVAATVTVLTVGKLPDEATLARYVTVEVSPGMEYLTLPQGGFTFVATNHPPVPGTAGKLTPNYDLSLTWEQIPAAAIGTVLYNPSLQNPAIDNCLGCCNSAPFPPAPAATTFQLMTAFPAAGGTS